MNGMTAGQLIEMLGLVPADSPVRLEISPGRRVGRRYAVKAIKREQLMADGPPNGLGGPTKVGTGVWVVTIR